MSSSVYYGCGCRFEQDGVAVGVQPCQRHREVPFVQLALEALKDAQSRLVVAVRDAHEELSPLQVEQEERAASADGRGR